MVKNVFRRIVVVILSAFLWIFFKPILTRLGYKTLRIGHCTFMAPGKQLEVIARGTDRLHGLDPDLFSKLASQKGLIFWYHKQKLIQAKRIISITDDWLVWGADGVATFLAESLIGLEYRESRDYDFDVSAAVVRDRLCNWVAKHQINPELKAQYASRP